MTSGELVGARVDLVTCDELSFPQVVDEFTDLGAPTVFAPDKIVVAADHDSPARDVQAAERMIRTRAFALKHGIPHLLVGGDAGIVHVVLPELGFVAPGDLVVGYDSHMLTAGALGAIALGVGASDAAVAMAFGEVWLRVPESVRIVIEGQPRGWVGPKDVGIELVRRLGQVGCLYQSVEFEGSYSVGLGMDGRLTLASMAIELGAKCAVQRPDRVTLAYCEHRVTRPFEPVWSDPGAEYAATHEFDVDDLEPQVCLPGSPDRGEPVRAVAGEPLDQVFIGSCTNGRLEDLRVAAAVLSGHRVHPRTRLVIVPGGPQVLRAALKEGLIETFVEAGAVVGPPGCGPCAGLHMGVLGDQEVGMATSSRNFTGRMGSPTSRLYIAGPAVAAASAIAGEVAGPEDVVGRTPPPQSVRAVSGRAQ